MHPLLFYPPQLHFGPALNFFQGLVGVAPRIHNFIDGGVAPLACLVLPVISFQGFNSLANLLGRGCYKIIASYGRLYLVHVAFLVFHDDHFINTS